MHCSNNGGKALFAASNTDTATCACTIGHLEGMKTKPRSCYGYGQGSTKTGLLRKASIPYPLRKGYGVDVLGLMDTGKGERTDGND